MRIIKRIGALLRRSVNGTLTKRDQDRITTYSVLGYCALSLGSIVLVLMSYELSNHDPLLEAPRLMRAGFLLFMGAWWLAGGALALLIPTRGSKKHGKD